MDKVTKFKDKQYLRTEPDDLTAILDFTVHSLKKSSGRPSEYPNTEEGLETFRNKTIEFFEYVNQVNQNTELNRKLIADVETWCLYLGISRQTLSNYYHRGAKWSECIDLIKNAILCGKKQLALNYKIPPMIFVFDCCNNHGYLNTAEFHLTQEPAQNKEEPLPDIDDIIRRYSPVFDDNEPVDLKPPKI